MTEPAESNLILADRMLNLTNRELLALSFQMDEGQKKDYRMAMIVKAQQTNEKLVKTTWLLAIGTIISAGLVLLLSALTLYFQYFGSGIRG